MTATLDTSTLSKIRDTVIPYDHQSEGVARLSQIQSWLNADEPGMGKSLLALMTAAIDFEIGIANRIIIIAPATLKENWHHEIEKQTHFTSRVIDGPKAQRDDQIAEFDEDILIINYELIGKHMGDLKAIPWDIAIIDEAHYLKGHKSQRTKFVHMLTADIPRRFLLTGTPLLNQVNGLWGLLHTIDPDEYPRYWGFTYRYCTFGGYEGKQITGVKNERELNERLAQVMLRRRKEDVLDLPEKNYTSIYVDMHATQRKLYEKAKNDLKLEVPEHPEPLELQSSLVAAGKLRMIATTPAALKDGDFPDQSYKMDVIVNRALEAIENGDRPIIFTEYRNAVTALEKRFAKAKIPTWSLHGGVPTKMRVDLVNQWGRSPKMGALICILSVGGVGLNMAEYSSTVIFATKSWTPGVNGQAIDRVHRVGADMTKPVTIVDVIVRDTIEERVEEVNALKIDLSNTIVDGAAAKEKEDLKKRLFDALREELES